MAKPFEILKRFGQGVKDTGSAAYGATDMAMGGRLPMGPIQGEHQIPLTSYIEKRRIKGDVLDALRGDVEYYINNGMDAELAVKLVLQNKRKDFEKILDPNSEHAKAIAEGDTKTPFGKNAHRSANVFKYFENASPKEYASMFKDYDVTNVDMVKEAFTMPDTGYSEETEPMPRFTHPSMANMPSPEFNKLGLVQDESGQWVPGTTQPAGGYGAENSRINRANPNAGPEYGYAAPLTGGMPDNIPAVVKPKAKRSVI